MLDTSRNLATSVPGPPTGPALLIEGLRKSYGATVALAGVDLRVEPGTILGLLGPNGAGKTSLVSIVAGLRRPDGGRVEVCGIDVGAVAPRGAGAARHRAPGHRRVPHAVACATTSASSPASRACAAREAAARIDEVAAALGLESLLDRRASQLSGGERRRRAHRDRAAAPSRAGAARRADDRRRRPDAHADPRPGRRPRARRIGGRVLDALPPGDRDAAAPTSRSSTGGASWRAARSPSSSTRHGTSSLELTFDGRGPERPRSVDGRGRRRQLRSHPRRRSRRRRAAQLLPALGADAGALRSIEILRPSLESVYLAVTGRRYETDTADGRTDVAPASRHDPRPRAPADPARPAAHDGADRVPDHHDGVHQARVPGRARNRRATRTPAAPSRSCPARPSCRRSSSCRS